MTAVRLYLYLKIFVFVEVVLIIGRVSQEKKSYSWETYCLHLDNLYIYIYIYIYVIIYGLERTIKRFLGRIKQVEIVLRLWGHHVLLSH